MCVGMAARTGTKIVRCRRSSSCPDLKDVIRSSDTVVAMNDESHAELSCCQDCANTPHRLRLWSVADTHNSGRSSWQTVVGEALACPQGSTVRTRRYLSKTLQHRGPVRTTGRVCVPGHYVAITKFSSRCTALCGDMSTICSLYTPTDSNAIFGAVTSSALTAA